MYIREANEEDLKALKEKCNELDGMVVGFSKVDFVDYTKYLDVLTKEYPHIKFEMGSCGIVVDLK